ncbi:hypothetical protein I0P70_17580 [Pontibacter sp. FD36]|uniref:hypothetical protein n=1 Tax=Pontibacter sp. FD36 TaxID=2789860 RepID=UPI0018A986EE|nr:hypothetical protein [Pontibacter sp. FD36]MBF8965063.1 hypothetical protein [Pontibacter sp. FD36]
MNRKWSTLSLGAAVIPGFLLFTSFLDKEDSRLEEIPPYSSIPMCGGGSSDKLDTHGAHLNCHSPVTSYVDLLPPPELMVGIGSSHIPITSNSKAAQQYFDQGLSMLHNFWDFEAYRAFKHAASLDSTAAMPYWGIAMSLNFSSQREKEYKAAIAKAKKLSDKASERERLYIRALATYDSLGNEKGVEAFKSGMEKLIYRYPDDVEAQLVLWLNGLSRGYTPEMAPKQDALYAQWMLEKLMKSHPDHPGVHHYYIHQMENCCPDKAIESADRLAALTPNSGHMVHMPGHIYYRIGDYEKSRASFIASMKVDSAYMASQQIQQLDNWNYMHNLHYLVANCTEEGRYKEANYWHQRLENIPPPADTLKDRLRDHRRMIFRRVVFYGADLDLRFGNWDKVAKRYSKLTDEDSVFATLGYSKTYRNALVLYAKGMDAIERKKLDMAAQHADALDAMLWRANKQENVSLSPYFENRFNAQSLELRGNLLAAKGETKKAVALLTQAQKLEQQLGYREPPYYARPVAESLANAYLLARQYDKALETYEAMLKARPNSGFAIYGIARTHELAGNQQKATQYYARFRETWRHADKDLPQVRKAEAWLKKNRT